MRLSNLGLRLLAASVALGIPTFVEAQIGGKITQLGSGGRSFFDQKPDLAYDPITDVYAHVWQSFNNTNQSYSIWLKLFDAKTGSGIPQGTFNMAGTGQPRNPCIAYIAKSGMFLVAWQDKAGASWDIKCRAYDPGTKAAGSTLTVTATAADEITPDIAGEGTKLDDDAVLVWDDESVGIRGVEIEVPSLAAVKVLTPKTLVAGGKPGNNNPSVSRSGGAARRIAMVWESAPQLVSVTAYTMDLAAASTILPFPLTNSFPQVDGDGTDFVIVFQRPESAKPTLGDIWCYAVRAPSAATQPMLLTAQPRAVAANADQDEKHPTVAFVGGSYLAAWAVVNKTDQFGKCRIQTLTPDCSTCGNGWLIQFGNRLRTVNWQAIASEYNSNAATTSRRARVMYDTGWIRQGNPAFLVQKVNYEVTGGPKSTVAAGCGAGGSLTFPEPFAFGESVTALLGGADSKATNSVAVIGTTTASRFPCGPCRILLGQIVLPVTVSGGRAQLSYRIPCFASFNNVDLDHQYVVLTPGTSPCPATLPNVSTSNILRAKIQ